jgi:hypothetical protein
MGRSAMPKISGFENIAVPLRTLIYTSPNQTPHHPRTRVYLLERQSIYQRRDHQKGAHSAKRTANKPSHIQHTPHLLRRLIGHGGRAGCAHVTRGANPASGLVVRGWRCLRCSRYPGARQVCGVGLRPVRYINHFSANVKAPIRRNTRCTRTRSTPLAVAHFVDILGDDILHIRCPWPMP